VKKAASGKKKVDKKIELAGQALHNEIGPLLSAAGLRLQLLRMDFPETADRINEITQTLELKPSPFSAQRSRNPKREYN
jgi:hypothetical protein